MNISTHTHSEAAIKVKLDTDGSVIGHVIDGLAAILAPLLDSGTVTQHYRNENGSA